MVIHQTPLADTVKFFNYVGNKTVLSTPPRDVLGADERLPGDWSGEQCEERLIMKAATSVVELPRILEYMDRLGSFRRKHQWPLDLWCSVLSESQIIGVNSKMFQCLDGGRI